MDNAVYLHIGIGKTGSTAIQHALFYNADKLLEYGWVYPDLHKKCNITRANGVVRDINGNVFFKRSNIIDESRWDIIWECINRFAQEYNVLISAESIRADFIRRAKQKCDNLKIIVYLRRQDLWIESMWAQAVKAACVTDSLEEYYRSKSNQCHYYEMISDIADIVGKDNIIIRIYEKEQLHKQNLLCDFAYAIGLPENIILDSDTSKCQNPSLIGYQIELKRLMNEVFLENNTNANWQYCNALLDLKIDDIDNNFSFMSDELRNEITNEYQEMNKRIAIEFLDRDDGILFYDKSSKKQKVFELSENEKLIFCTLSKMFFEKINNMDTIYKNNNALRNRIGDRKLILWGGGAYCRVRIDSLQIRPEMIIDNNEKREGEYINSIPIISSKRIKDWSEYFVLITPDDYKDIVDQLTGYGLEILKDFDFMRKYL